MINIIKFIPIPFSIYACITDIKERKIRNHTTYPLIILGILYSLYLEGYKGIMFSISSLVTAIIIISIISFFMNLGGGDIKLILGYSLFLARKKIAIFILLFISLSFIYSAIIFIKKNGIKHFINEIHTEIKTWGIYKTRFENKIGAPILLLAYLVTVLII